MGLSTRPPVNRLLIPPFPLDLLSERIYLQKEKKEKLESYYPFSMFKKISERTNLQNVCSFETLWQCRKARFLVFAHMLVL